MKADKIFDSLAPEEVLGLFGPEPKADRKPGRDPELTQRRNRKMAARLYYYRTFHPRVRNEFIMQLMMQDFDLSLVRIAEVVAELDAELQHLKSIKPDLSWFWKRWPRMLWSMDMPDADWYGDNEELKG